MCPFISYAQKFSGRAIFFRSATLTCWRVFGPLQRSGLVKILSIVVLLTVVLKKKTPIYFCFLQIFMLCQQISASPQCSSEKSSFFHHHNSSASVIMTNFQFSCSSTTFSSYFSISTLSSFPCIGWQCDNDLEDKLAILMSEIGRTWKQINEIKDI